MRMYEIPAVLRRLHDDAVDPETGEIAEGYEDQIAALEMELGRKLEYLALLSREKKAEAKAYASEAKRLAAKQRSLQNEERRLKDFIHAMMLSADMKKLDGELVKIGVQRNGRPSIVWTGHPDDIPEDFVIVVPEERKLDSDAALKAWKDSAENPDERGLPDGFVVDLGTHVRVR